MTIHLQPQERHDAGDTGKLYQGTGSTLPVGANSFDVFLVDPGPGTGSGTKPTATAANGIVAVDDGTWAGVVDLGLPFP